MKFSSQAWMKLSSNSGEEASTAWINYSSSIVDTLHPDPPFSLPFLNNLQLTF